jgi:hypothetical protein
LLPTKVYVDAQDDYILGAANAYTNLKFSGINLGLYYTKLEVDYLLPSKANDNEVVKLEGNQTINGVKTFNNPPLSTTQPSTTNQVTNKQYVDKFNTDEVITLLATGWSGNNYNLNRSVIDETKFMMGIPTPSSSINVNNIVNAILFVTQLSPSVIISCITKPTANLNLAFRRLS